SFSDPEIISVEEENVVYHEEEEVDLEDISQIQDVDLREKLLSINRLIANIESLYDNPTPDCMLNSFVSIPTFEESDNSLSDNFLPEFETFCDHTEETRSDTTTHADDSLLEYDSFCFEIEPDQERLINVLKNEISDDSTNDPLLEEADLFLTSDNSIPPGIENFGNDLEGDIHFLEALLIDDSILFLNYEQSNFDNSSFPRPPLEPPDAEFDFELDAGEEISVVIDELECLSPRDEFDDDDYSSFMFAKVFSFLLSAESVNTIFDPAGSESRPPMLNKENYAPWWSRLLRYAKSRPNGKLIHNSILNGPYIEADDQAIQTILLGLPEDIYEKKAKLFNEWERITFNEGESIESYYHRFLKLMNDLKRNKHFPEKIASNLKFLNNLQPEWSRHVTIVHQTKDLHTADYTQLYDFLKYNQKEVEELKAETLAKT
nr:hypothetical protein [Tanacetum cinerariifolium]